MRRMVSIVDGSGEGFSEYMEEQGVSPGAGRRCLVAVEGGKPIGHVCYRKGSMYRIEGLRVSEGAPDDTAERLVKAVMATVANSGAGELSIHSLDPSGAVDTTCRRLGFYSTGCPCCQRTGSVCLSKRFRSVSQLHERGLEAGLGKGGGRAPIRAKAVPSTAL